jgi:hypothetical protein
LIDALADLTCSELITFDIYRKVSFGHCPRNIVLLNGLRATHD